VANVDQALVIFSITKPAPSLNLLDRFLIMMRQQNLPCIICFNKQDLADESQVEKLKQIYAASGYELLFISAKKVQDVENVMKYLRGKTTTVAGPSGVGKSTLINRICPEALMETGEISQKIERGRHTTRHSELFWLQEDTFIFDTPGFSTIYLDKVEAEELRFYFPEINRFEGQCRFLGCIHDREPGCRVKQAVSEGAISSERYEHYLSYIQECKSRRKY